MRCLLLYYQQTIHSLFYKIRLYKICVLAGLALTATQSKDFWVDASRIQNGNGSKEYPWKNVNDIRWNSIKETAESTKVNIYFSSRDTWKKTSLHIDLPSPSHFKVVLDGESFYCLVDSGIAKWHIETKKGNLATFSDNANINIVSGSCRVSIVGFRLEKPLWGGINIGNTNPTINTHNIDVINCYINSPVNNHGIWFGYAEAGCHSIRIIGNTIIKTPLEGIYIGHYNYLAQPIRNITISNNTLIDCGTHGEGDIDLKPPVQGALVENNLIKRSREVTTGKSSGIVVGGDSVIVRNNMIINMKRNVEADDWGFGIYVTADGDLKTGRSISNCWIYNNVISECEGGGIKIGATKSGYNIEGLNIINNTIYKNKKNGIKVVPSNGATISIERILNNIIAKNEEYELFYSGADVKIKVCDFNLYYDSTPDTLILSTNGVKNWEGWQQMGFDLKGTYGEPLLSDLFFPLPASAAIGKGKNLETLFNFDKDYKARNNVWDIGAYETDGVPLPESGKKISGIRKCL